MCRSIPCNCIKDGSYKHPTTVFELKAPGPYIPPIGQVAVAADDGGRVNRWMAWKHTKELRHRLSHKLAAAQKRGSRGTNVPLHELADLLALVEVGGEPA